MKLKHTLLFFISIVLISFSVVAQETKTDTPTDTISKATKYGLRLGLDLAKPIRSLLEDGYSGFELMGDYRITKKFYLAAELGNDKKDRFETNLSSRASGSYIKVGGDFNAYNNWFGLNNALYFGLRYGLSTFKQELLSYQIYSTDQTFPATTVEDPIEYSGLTAHWGELIFGVKTEVVTNLYLSINLQLKLKVAEDTPEGFSNLYIPGFNQTNDFSEFGVGYGYTISYLLPLYKK
ncbi:DUF6048 family protein [Ulvibacter litoralis]|uniref:Outer membrane protein beta-barrel domain-containing protein n=1 Tax=Ulvibacter litoralis TaxID=227084 RepID=A0A1G7FW98_9FLAO|nr:DUF6048 family protein [Ulvibacter litoralis]GHC64079.1 hypothetical protein GCM10008083_31710 [Ulvibacter litoralis]SDE80025.1 hypothetical protein SAMN05421855_102812 [Ulvibacter litoralis]